MWTDAAEQKTKELGLTKSQIDELSGNTNVGVNIITSVLTEAVKLGLITLPKVP